MSEENVVTQDIVPVKKVGSPLMVKGGKTLNPYGRPRKDVSKAGEAKEEIFRAFLEAGGRDRLCKLIKGRKVGTTKESKAHAENADKRFLETVYRAIVPLAPKKTEMDIETRSVVFEFTGTTEEFKKAKDELNEPIDIQFDNNPEDNETPGN